MSDEQALLPQSAAKLDWSDLSVEDSVLSNETKPGRQGIVFDKWPFRLDIDVEYQDWILIAAVMLAVGIMLLPFVCGRMRNSCSRSFSRLVYTHIHIFFMWAIYFDLFFLMITIGVLPDWSVNQFLERLILFITWVLVHLQKLIVSVGILCGFVLIVRFRDRLLMAAGMEHITIFRYSWKEFFGFHGKRRPVEIFIWKVDKLSSNMKKVKANDIYIECHLGHNEPMRTRVHNNAGSSCNIRESFQVNIDENATGALMTLLVKDQSIATSSELGRLMLSTRELFGIEDQTGKRRVDFEYSEDSFVALELSPSGKIWIAIAPVNEIDEDERMPLMQEDRLLLC